MSNDWLPMPNKKEEGQPMNEAWHETSSPVASSQPTVPAIEVADPSSLSERLQVLERTVAQLSNTKPLEDRVTARVLEQLHHDPLAIKECNQTVETAPVAVQRAMPIPSESSRTVAEFHLPPVALPAPLPESNLTSLLRPLPSAMPLARGMLDRVIPASSLLRDVWWDLRIGYRMLRDPIYPMTFACKVIPLFALIYVTIWPWFSSWSGMIGTVMNGLVYIVVLYVAFKVIHRELHRYYEFAVKYRRL
jgi:hypothetical protein